MKTLMILLTVLATSLASERMVNLANNDPKVLQALFKNFQHAEGRVYANAQEARMRLKNFRRFVGQMAAANDEPDGVEYGVTFFADLTEAEAQQFYGFANSTGAPAPDPDDDEYDGEPLAPAPVPHPDDGPAPRAPAPVPHPDDGPAPRAPAPVPHPDDGPAPRSGPGAVDHKHRYNSAKHQGSCGSCWAFTTTGVLEGWAHIRSGGKPSLSEQQVLDCSGSSNGCGGGWYYEALRIIKSNNHLASANDYRYQTRKGSCRRTSYRNALPFRVSGVYKAGRDSDIASRLNSGPLGVAMDFRNIKIRGYYSGVWSNTNCKQWPNHAITLTGYTSSYWEIRNSWGTGWGNRGYLKITRKVQNVCMIASNAWYITAGSQEELE